MWNFIATLGGWPIILALVQPRHVRLHVLQPQQRVPQHGAAHPCTRRAPLSAGHQVHSDASEIIVAWLLLPTMGRGCLMLGRATWV